MSAEVGASDDVEEAVGDGLLVGAEFDVDVSLDCTACSVIDEGADGLLDDADVEDVLSTGVVVPLPDELPPGVCGTGGIAIWMTTWTVLEFKFPSVTR